MSVKYLLNRSWDHAGFGWYDPGEMLKGYKPVVKVEYTDTTSSAGDWSGYIIIKDGKKWLMVPFDQQNRYPYRGYRVATGSVMIRYNSRPADPTADYCDYTREQMRAHYQYLADTV